jgi:sarcosine oxidase subunit gamma
LIQKGTVFVHDLTALTPLGAQGARVTTFDGVEITENPDWALASVAARQDRQKQLSAAAKKLLGGALPGVSLVSGTSEISAFWIGPEQWMFQAPFATHEDLAAQLKKALKDTASVVEQTDGWVRFEVKGARAMDVFERLCALDTRAMATGHVTRTAIEHMSCFVICQKAGHAFSVLGARSSAASLHHAMCTAAKSVT